MTQTIKRAMILAAGKGTRMGAVGRKTPKPLVKVAGRPLLDHTIDRLKHAGVQKIVVNVHHLADQIETHLAKRRTGPQIVISDERNKLLETGGGVQNALPHLGAEPFFVMNGDALWLDGVRPALARMAACFKPEYMDMLLMLAPLKSAVGHEGRGDFIQQQAGKTVGDAIPLAFRDHQTTAPYVFAGVQITKPEHYKKPAATPWSNLELFQHAAARGRLYGWVLDGVWMHVGTPGALAAAKKRMAKL